MDSWFVITRKWTQNIHTTLFLNTSASSELHQLCLFLSPVLLNSDRICPHESWTPLDGPPGSWGSRAGTWSDRGWFFRFLSVPEPVPERSRDL